MRQIAPQKLAFPVLVIIPCLNEYEHIDGVISEVLEQIGGSGSQIIVADGGSTDGTIDKVQHAAKQYVAVTYMNNPKRIQSAAINLAVEEYGASFDFCIRIDAHATYPTGFIATLTHEAHRAGVSAVVVPMATVGRAPRQKAIAAAQNSRLGNGGSKHRQGGGGLGQYVDHGHHALISISAFKEVGGYDETFSHNEDAEFDVRLGLAGHRIWLTGGTFMIYYPRVDFLPLARQYFGYGVGRAHTALKHKIWPRPRQLLPALLIPLSVIALLSPLSPPLAIPMLFWLAIICMQGVAIIHTNPDIGSLVGLLSVIWAICIMHMAWSSGFCYSLVLNIFACRSQETAKKGAV